MFRRLESYVARTGSAAVPAAVVEEGERLGQWASAQRTAIRKGELAADQTARLRSLPGGRTIRGGRALRFVGQLGAYALEHGHTQMPPAHVIGGVRVGQAIYRYRRQRAAGRKLPAWLVGALEAVPHWTWEHDPAGPYVAALKAFAATHGHTRVARHAEIDGLKVGVWVGNQRTRARKPGYDPQVKARLESVPAWTWDPRGDLEERMLSLVDDYVAEFGTALVARGTVYRGARLGEFVHSLRQRYWRGRENGGRRLPERVIARCEAYSRWAWLVRRAPGNGATRPG